MINNSISNSNSYRNSSNTLLLLSYIQSPFPSSPTFSTPLSKNKYNNIRKFFKVKTPRSISSLKSFSLPTLKSLYSLQGSGRSHSLFSLSNFLRFERQVDVVLVRSNLVSSLPEARLFIKNGFVFINGRKLSSYYLLQSGDILSLNSSLPVSSLPVLPIPKYLIVNPSTRSIIFTHFTFLDIPHHLKFFHKYLLDLHLLSGNRTILESNQ